MNNQDLQTLWDALKHKGEPCRDQFGEPILVCEVNGITTVYRCNTADLGDLIWEVAADLQLNPSERDICVLQDRLSATARRPGKRERDVFLRVAPHRDGVQIDSGDENHMRFDIQPGQVTEVTGANEPLFYRAPGMAPFRMPADKGDISRLNRYLNLTPPHQQLLLGYITYTLVTARTDSANFLHLQLVGGPGTGKSALCRMLIPQLVDPTTWGMQIFPQSKRDLVIALRNAHVSIFDNVRDLSKRWSDVLCVAATGGSLSARQLFTDRDELRSQVHGPIVLNCVAPVVEEPDLAQRCLTLELLQIPEDRRKPEAQLNAEFQADLPAIFKGMLDLMAAVLLKMPAAEVIHPERMLEFVQWIAGMELAMGIPQGDLQSVYSETLKDSQQAAVFDSPLGSAIVELMDGHKDHTWQGTPTALLNALRPPAQRYLPRAEWPHNAVALSKRLRQLAPALLSQGLVIDFHRGKERTVSIQKEGGDS